jgi:hypothetical protein
MFAIWRRPGRRVFEVRWRVAGGDRSRSFITRALADSYRAELIRAARRGLEFDPATGEPLAWAAPAPVTVTWYQHAVAYAAMKWPHLAAHSRASMAEALATVTPLLTKTTSRRSPARMLRAALYGYAFSPLRRSRAPEPATASVLAWLERNSLPVSCLSDPQVIRAALDGLCMRLDGSPAAANIITRKRAVFHNALSYAVELGLLPANPAGTVQWHAPKAAVAVSPQTVASPAQVQAILAQVAASPGCTRPAAPASAVVCHARPARPAASTTCGPRRPSAAPRTATWPARTPGRSGRTAARSVSPATPGPLAWPRRPPHADLVWSRLHDLEVAVPHPPGRAGHFMIIQKLDHKPGL